MVEEGLHARIERERKTIDPAAPEVAVYRRYAEGTQASTLSPEMHHILGAAARHPYADNVPDMVISAWASRLVLERFEVEDQAVADFLSGLFTRNALGDLSYDVNYATGRDGNHALMLRWLPDGVTLQDQSSAASDGMAAWEAEQGDVALPAVGSSGRVTVHAEPWWDGKTGVWVSYDDQGRPAYAVKDFIATFFDSDGNATERLRRTVYWPDMIQRFVQDGEGWRPFPLPGERPDGVVPWLKRDGSPLGIPVIHFSFPRFGERTYGVSELAGGVLANVDHINDLQQAIASAARMAGYQVLWATGAQFASAPRLSPGAFLYSASGDAKFGAIPAGDLTQLMAAHQMKLQTVARMTATPMHVISGGDWPSGMALVQAERPLIAKVRRLAAVIGPSWATVAHRATEIANAFGGLQLNEDSLISSAFEDPEQLDQMAQAELLQARAQAQLSVEMLTSAESLMAVGMTRAEADARANERLAAGETINAALTGIG